MHAYLTCNSPNINVEEVNRSWRYISIAHKASYVRSVNFFLVCIPTAINRLLLMLLAEPRTGYAEVQQQPLPQLRTG